MENALYHGLKNKRGGGMIKITGRLDGENMIFTVTDEWKRYDERSVKKNFRKVLEKKKEIKVLMDLGLEM